MQYKSKEALDQFLEVIKNADKTFLDPEKNIDEQGVVDGYQHIFHLLQTSISFYLFNDPLRPDFMLLATPYHKVLGDNVDSVYYFTQIRGDQEYIIKGKRYDSCYLSFALYGGGANGEISERVTQNINHTDIDFEEDGSFEIKLCKNPSGRNEFKIDEDSVTLFTREYFFDRTTGKESDLSIENTAKLPPPLPLDDEELARRIKVMTTFFEQTTWIAPLPVEFPLNDFLDPFAFEMDQGGWGTPDNIYCFGRFRLEDDEYLKINFRSPECCYWGMQTWNYLMQSMDYKNYDVCLNNSQAVQNEDGSYDIYISHKKMDVDNWVSTAGYKEAILFFRWLIAEEMPSRPTVIKGNIKKIE
jgi:hypothetical protein